MTNVLAAVAVALSVVGLSATARADPDPFTNLSCSCPSLPDYDPDDRDQIARGIRDGLADSQTPQRPAFS